MTPTSRRTSSHVAMRDATGRSSDVSWCSLREVEKPIAPACIAASSWADMRARSSSVPPSSKAPLPHRPRPQRRVPDVGGAVDRLGQPVERVQVLGEGLPAPLDPRRHGPAVDVLGPLEVAHDERALLGLRRCEREAAVPHDDGRHTLPAGAPRHGVPEELRVEVRVPVDEARRDDVALGVDLAPARFADPSDGRDRGAGDPDVRPVRAQARSVDDRAVADHQVVVHRSPSAHLASRSRRVAPGTRGPPPTVTTVQPRRTSKYSTIWSAELTDPRRANRAD